MDKLLMSALTVETLEKLKKWSEENSLITEVMGFRARVVLSTSLEGLIDNLIRNLKKAEKEAPR